MSLSIGTILSGNRGEYLIGKHIGKFGKKELYEGRQISDEKEVVIREFQSNNSAEADYFMREACYLDKFMTCQIFHKQIDFVGVNNRVYTIWEKRNDYIDLREYRKSTGGKPNDIVLFIDFLVGLERVHKKGMVLQCISPEVLYVEKETKLKIVISAEEGYHCANHCNPVVTATKIMAPEQWSGERITPKTDVYQMGAVLYWFLTGRLLKEDSFTISPKRRHCELQKSLEEVDIPKKLQNVILKSLELKPMRRYWSAKKFADKLYDAYEEMDRLLLVKGQGLEKVASTPSASGRSISASTEQPIGSKMEQKNEIQETKSLYQRCFEASAHQDTIRLSCLPFENGYYVTESNVILMVEKPLVYVLKQETEYSTVVKGATWTTTVWANDQSYFSLWYGSMKNFADISPEIASEIGLHKVFKSVYEKGNLTLTHMSRLDGYQANRQYLSWHSVKEIIGLLQEVGIEMESYSLEKDHDHTDIWLAYEEFENYDELERYATRMEEQDDFPIIRMISFRGYYRGMSAGGTIYTNTGIVTFGVK